jgi:hypothetical protein
MTEEMSDNIGGIIVEEKVFEKEGMVINDAEGKGTEEIKRKSSEDDDAPADSDRQKSKRKRRVRID